MKTEKLEEKELKAIQDSTVQNLPVDEVIDFVADAYEFGEFVNETFADGVQAVSDGLAIYGKREQIMEFVSDWPIFKAQLSDVQGDEPTEIVEGIVLRLDVKVNRARKILKDALVFAQSLYEVYNAGSNLIKTVKG